MTSSVSFSCGNIFPSVLKSSKAAIIIGQNTGGGNCLVMASSTACCDLFNKLSGYKFTAIKITGGEYIKSDQGIKPDNSLIYQLFYSDYIYEFIQDLK